MKSSSEIRKAFLNYFNNVGHEIVSSSPLPQKDNPTLLFTNAGMNQFANTFLGVEKRPYNRAVTAQKCMRIAGKHNDLENVGPSPRHHTFFEMLGNFSFGDYFKTDAIAYAWEFLTSPDHMGLDIERLWISIYDDDDEAFELWQKHVPADRILRFGKSENFWEMGDVGPCGPCSEIHYYWGDLDKMTPDGVNVDDEYLEIWNLVFMQYEKDESGTMTPLPKPSIDTGMGLERLAQILQDKVNNYDTDVFTPAMDMVQELLGDDDAQRDEKYVGYRVIADHVRAATFMLSDGVRPGNDGADYVLRMVIRRAAKFGREIGFSDPFMASVAHVYIEQMAEAYPELRAHADHIKHSLTQEEDRFSRTLDRALIELDKLLAGLKENGQSEVPGDIAFDLYATHGLPVEITNDIAQEQGFTVDADGFLEAKEAHKIASGKGAFKGYDLEENIYAKLFNELVEEGVLPAAGVAQKQYDEPRLQSKVVAILRKGERTDVAKKGDTVELITAETPFYVESGGQMSDIGSMTVSATGCQMRITGMSKPVDGLLVHAGKVVDGEVKLGANVMLRVDNSRRADIRRNHTATHILHEELRRHLGTHVTQAGSLVAPDRLRFDFTHGESVGADVLQKIEQAINAAIMANYPLSIADMGQKEAIDHGAMALFGEKYGDIVRTVKIGKGDVPYSFELCGGLHVSETGDIGLFHFLNEGSVSSGVRRVEAITGRAARDYVFERLALLGRLSRKLNTPADELEGRISGLMDDNRTLQKEIESIKKESLVGGFEGLMQQVQEVNGVKLLAAQVDGADADGLRELTDRYRDKVGSGVAVLAAVSNDKPILIAVVTDDLTKRGLHAGNIIREVAKMVGGGGGGRPTMAQAGGRDAARLPEALAAVPNLVASSLKN